MSARGNIRQTWQVIKSLVKGPSSSKELGQEIKIDNNVVTDSNVIVDKFNFVVVDVGPNLA